MMGLVKRIIKKLMIIRYYKHFVIHDTVIQEDVQQSIAIRGCRVPQDTLKAKFHHLMSYYPDFAFIFFWRIDRLQSYWTRFFMSDPSCKIFRSTTIDGGLMCYHPYATVINAQHIGANFQFRNGLTIGNKGNDNRKLPSIGNNVTVGAQVVIIGDIQIGDNVVIGAGSVVVKNVPSNSVVAGNPAKVIRTLEHE